MSEQAGSLRTRSRLAFAAVACLALAVGLLPALAAPASAAVPAGARAEDGVVVKLRTGASSSDVASTVGGKVLSSLSRGRAVVRSGQGLDRVLGQLARDPRVEWVEPNMRYAAAVQPNDPCLTGSCGASPVPQWGPAMVRAPQAWDITKGSTAIRVAVIDGGVDASHSDLDGKVTTGFDFTGTAPDSCAEHGTHVAGTIAAITDNAKGVAGLGWRTTVRSYRVLHEVWDPTVGEFVCSGSTSSIAHAIDKAFDEGIRVMNLSLAGEFKSKALEESVRAAVQAGAVVVAAAGNAGELQFGNPLMYPAAYPEALAVAASTPDDQTAYFSEHGSWVDIAAPGYRIVSTVPGGGYDEMSGTSMATPHVAAAAALVFAKFPGITGYDVVSRLQLNADTYAGSGTDVRYGRLNMYRPLASGGPGYYMVASDGGIFAFGESPFYGSTGSLVLNEPIFAMAVTPRRKGYWFVARDGGIFNYGDALFFGSRGGMANKGPIVGMASTPTGQGYWMVTTNGAVYYFGDAKPFGSVENRPLAAPIVGMASTWSGQGYWLVAADGAVFPFGDAGSFGSMAGAPLNRPIVGMSPTVSGQGYWLVATDGGIFSFGDAVFHGSTGGIVLNKPIVGMKVSPAGNGYWLVASDGGIFAFNVPFYGSMGGTPLNRPVVGMA